MPLTVVNGPTIPKGEALSEAIDCSAGELVRITMPSAWSAEAILTFQISTDGLGFNDLCGPDGVEYQVEVIPGAAVLVGEEVSRALGFIKFRSGTRYGDMLQEEQRTFALTIKTP